MANSWERWVKRLDKDKEKHCESAQILTEGEGHGFEVSALYMIFFSNAQCLPQSLFTQNFGLYFLFLREWKTRCWTYRNFRDKFQNTNNTGAQRITVRWALKSLAGCKENDWLFQFQRKKIILIIFYENLYPCQYSTVVIKCFILTTTKRLSQAIKRMKYQIWYALFTRSKYINITWKSYI